MATDNSSPSGIHSQAEVDAIFASDSARALREYMQLVEDTESPMSYYLWSLVAAASGLLGRRCHFDNGPFSRIYPNLYVLLMGPVGVRKSSSISTILKLTEHTTLNRGPSDTGGQRHGIMTAMQGLGRPHKRLKLGLDSIPQIAPMLLSAAKNRPSGDIFLATGELGRLMGPASREMADFLDDIYKGQDITYQTKAGETRIPNTLGTLLAATTPSSLATMMPDSIVGHGLLSRFIFVFEERKRKSIPLPPQPEEVWYARYEDFKYRLTTVDSMTGGFHMSRNAADFYSAIYGYVPAIEDPRLNDYAERRATHLLKIGMALASLRGYMTIEEDDLRLGHEMLATLEPKMHRALDYIGRNKTIRGKMLMIEHLRGLGPNGSATLMELCAVASTELAQYEAEIAIQQMVAVQEITHMGEAYMLGTTRNEFVRSRLRRQQQLTNRKESTND